ncbi:Histone H2A.Z-specific chaperone [Pyricularia oryzae]|nr:Histone H2A.Z-specific chaperone [Pyricularia oryzae]
MEYCPTQLPLGASGGQNTKTTEASSCPPVCPCSCARKADQKSQSSTQTFIHPPRKPHSNTATNQESNHTMASEETGVTAPGAQEVANAGVASEAKGKGKGPAQDTHDTEMDEDDEDDTEADEAEQVAEEVEDDGMDEIDSSNVLPSRTRGRKIDFAKAAAEQNLSVDDDEEDDDDDFNDPDAEDDKMDED